MKTRYILWTLVLAAGLVVGLVVAANADHMVLPAQQAEMSSIETGPPVTLETKARILGRLCFVETERGGIDGDSQHALSAIERANQVYAGLERKYNVAGGPCASAGFLLFDAGSVSYILDDDSNAMVRDFLASPDSKIDVFVKITENADEVTWHLDSIRNQ